MDRGPGGIFLQTYQQNQFSYESRIENKRKRPNLLHRNRLQAKSEVKRSWPEPVCGGGHSFENGLELVARLNGRSGVHPESRRSILGPVFGLTVFVRSSFVHRSSCARSCTCQ